MPKLNNTLTQISPKDELREKPTDIKIKQYNESSFSPEKKSKTDKLEKVNKIDKLDKLDKLDKFDKFDKFDKLEKVEKRASIYKSEKFNYDLRFGSGLVGPSERKSEKSMNIQTQKKISDPFSKTITNFDRKKKLSYSKTVKNDKAISFKAQDLEKDRENGISGKTDFLISKSRKNSRKKSTREPEPESKDEIFKIYTTNNLPISPENKKNIANEGMKEKFKRSSMLVDKITNNFMKKDIKPDQNFLRGIADNITRTKARNDFTSIIQKISKICKELIKSKNNNNLTIKFNTYFIKLQNELLDENFISYISEEGNNSDGNDSSDFF